MAKTLGLKKAISFIEEHGILLVFPVNNREQPRSLWSSFFPRSEMKWEWDQDGDTRVSDLWILREELSRSGDVVYLKWYRGRATFFSRELFLAMLTMLRTPLMAPADLSREASELLDILEVDSPQSTKALKKAADLQGKFYEARYARALKELWMRLLIVGFGEVDDGAFPSLAMGATKNIFEDLYGLARKNVQMGEISASARAVDRFLPRGSLFRKFFDEVDKKTRANDDIDGAKSSARQGDGMVNHPYVKK